MRNLSLGRIIEDGYAPKRKKRSTPWGVVASVVIALVVVFIGRKDEDPAPPILSIPTGVADIIYLELGLGRDSATAYLTDGCYVKIGKKEERLIKEDLLSGGDSPTRKWPVVHQCKTLE